MERPRIIIIIIILLLPLSIFRTSFSDAKAKGNEGAVFGIPINQWVFSRFLFWNLVFFCIHRFQSLFSVVSDNTVIEEQFKTWHYLAPKDSFFCYLKGMKKKYIKTEIILHRTVADPSRKRSTTDIPSEEAMSPTSKSRWNITTNKKI